MSLYYPTTQPAVAASIIVRKERRLPVPGEILVRIGARVEPDDVVARAAIGAPPQSLDVAAGLGLRPKNAPASLAHPVGTILGEGDVLATRRLGVTRKVQVKSPMDGTLTAYDSLTGIATMTPTATVFELRALIHGVVTEHLPGRGVILDTPAALVRGILGIGGEQHGVLQVAVTDPTDELLPELVTARHAFSIVLGGGTTTAAALQRAVEQRARAVIVGSIPEAELRAFLGYPDGLHGWQLGRTGWQFPPPIVSAHPVPPPPLTLIIVEGIGRVPMAAKAWELLASFDGQEVAVNGTTRLRDGLARPEILVPLPGGTPAAPHGTTAPPLTLRGLVRLIAPPYLGQTGRVVAVSQGKQPLGSGLTANAAEVLFQDGMTVWIPVANLEVLE